MMYKYFDFRYFTLLESILKVDPNFLSLIKSIADKGDAVGSMLNNLISKDIKTNVNYLKVSDKNDDMKFVNDTQVKRFIDAGQDPFDRATNSAKVGRTVRQILTTNGISVTDQQIEKFVNLYKNSWDKSFKKTGEGIHLVSGEDIRNWYHHSKYVPGGGQLNSSCMRYDETQDFLNIYTENPEVCQLVILVDDRNRLLGRALLWKLVDGINKYGYYLDRIYTRFDSDGEKFADWYKDFIKATDDDFKAHYIGRTSNCKVQLKKWKFKFYPYMDTLAIIDYETGILATYQIEDSKRLQLHIQNTSGEPSVPNYNWSNFHQKYIPLSESVYISERQDYFLKTECVQDYKNDWLYKEDAIYSDYYQSYIKKENSQELEGFGLVDSDDILEVYDSIVDGGPSDMRKFLYTKLKGSKYVEVGIRWNSYWVNSDFCYYDAYENHYFVKTDLEGRYQSLYSVNLEEYSDINNNLFDNLLDKFNNYYQSYGSNSELYKFPIFHYLYMNGSSYNEKERDFFASGEMLDFLNLKPDGRTAVYMKNNDYFKGFSKMCYKYNIIELNKLSENIDGCDINPLLKKLKIIDGYLYSNDIGNYRTINDTYANMIKYGTFTKYLNTTLVKLYKGVNFTGVLLSDKSINEYFSYIKNQKVIVISNNGLDSIDFKDTNLKDNLKDILTKFKEILLYFSYWYIILSNDDAAYMRTEDYISTKGFEISPDLLRVLTWFCIYTDVGGEYSEYLHGIRSSISKFPTSEFLKENNMSLSSDKSKKSIEIYNDFLDLLK